MGHKTQIGKRVCFLGVRYLTYFPSNNRPCQMYR